MTAEGLVSKTEAPKSEAPKVEILKVETPVAAFELGEPDCTPAEPAPITIAPIAIASIPESTPAPKRSSSEFQTKARACFRQTSRAFGWMGSVILSLALLGGLAELASRVATYLNPATIELPVGHAAAASAVAAVTVALLVRVLNGRAGFPAGTLHDTLRTLAFGAILLPAWAVTFAFPNWVGAAGALVVAFAWAMLFRFRNGSAFRNVASVSLPLLFALLGAGRALYVPAPSALVALNQDYQPHQQPQHAPIPAYEPPVVMDRAPAESRELNEMMQKLRETPRVRRSQRDRRTGQ